MSSIVQDERYAISTDNMIRKFPDALKLDKSVLTIATTEAGWLERDLPDIDMARIYARIDEAPEGLLDILARDLAVEWYDYDYSLESKRELVKASFFVHRFLGTPAAVTRMLSAVFPGSWVEEWFQYGGEPHHFQVVIELRNAKEPANIGEIVRAITMVKRLSSWLDGIVYQTQINLVIETQVNRWLYSRYMDWNGATDGTTPWRATIFKGDESNLRVETQTSHFGHTEELDGTTPWRAVIAQLAESELKIEAEENTAKHRSQADREGEVTGTSPWRAQKAETAETVVAAETEKRWSTYRGEPDGTIPWRAQRDQDTATELAAETQRTPTIHRTPKEGATMDGTTPWRAEKAQTAETVTGVETEKRQSTYRGEPEGTFPWRAEKDQATETDLRAETQEIPKVYQTQEEGTTVDGETPWRAQQDQETDAELVQETQVQFLTFGTDADGKPETHSGPAVQPDEGLEISMEAETYYYKVEYDRENRWDS